MPDRMDSDTRARVTSAGGHGRAAKMSAEGRASSAANAGRAGHAPAALARRLVKAWVDLGSDDRAEVLAILTAGLPLRRHPKG